MRVLYEEGLATHLGPESWVAAREGSGQALTGEMQAGISSREIATSRCRRCPLKRKATRPPSQLARWGAVWRGPRSQARIEALLTEIGRSWDPTGLAARSARGSTNDALDVRTRKSDGFVVPKNLANNARLWSCGGRGGKAPDEGEYAGRSHWPDTAPESNN